jgi:hypothetical protein
MDNTLEHDDQAIVGALRGYIAELRELDAIASAVIFIWRRASMDSTPMRLNVSLGRSIRERQSPTPPI